MQTISKIAVLFAVVGITGMPACYGCGTPERKIKHFGKQIDRCRCGDIAKTQLRVIDDLSQCSDPDINTIESAYQILSSGKTFPRHIERKAALDAAWDMFDGLPGFRAKFVDYLRNLDQEQFPERFWRELSLALEIECSDGVEQVVGFDQPAIGNFFSLSTTQRWIYWQHEKLHPSAKLESSSAVVSLKHFFMWQKALVDYYNEQNGQAIKYCVFSACPVYKSWQKWFAEQGIAVQVDV